MERCEGVKKRLLKGQVIISDLRLFQLYQHIAFHDYHTSYFIHLLNSSSIFRWRLTSMGVYCAIIVLFPRNIHYIFLLPSYIIHLPVSSFFDLWSSLLTFGKQKTSFCLLLLTRNLRSSHTLAILMSKPRSSLGTGQKQPTVWLHYGFVLR